MEFGLIWEPQLQVTKDSKWRAVLTCIEVPNTSERHQLNTELGRQL